MANAKTVEGSKILEKGPEGIVEGPKSLRELFPGAAIRTGNLVFDENGNILGEVDAKVVPEEVAEVALDLDPEDDK